MWMPRRGTRSPSSLATRRVSSDRFSGTSMSFAKYRTSVENRRSSSISDALRWTQTISNDNRPATGGVPVECNESARVSVLPISSALPHREMPLLRNRANWPGPSLPAIIRNTIWWSSPTARPPRSVAVSAAHQGCDAPDDVLGFRTARGLILITLALRGICKRPRHQKCEGHPACRSRVRAARSRHPTPPR
jgi:hypothetical protein